MGLSVDPTYNYDEDTFEDTIPVPNVQHVSKYGAIGSTTLLPQDAPQLLRVRRSGCASLRPTNRSHVQEDPFYASVSFIPREVYRTARRVS